MSLAGKLLVASPVLADPNFFHAVVLMLEHDDEGAVGVILNRPSGSEVGEHLPAWADQVCDPKVVFVGGPCEPAVAIGLQRTAVPPRPGPVEGVGLVDLGDGPEGTGPVRVFSGYSGWGPGQLESELDEGAWLVVEARAGDAFSPDPDGLWAAVLRRQQGALRMLATYPPDPALN